jgi:hypothetical protein
MVALRSNLFTSALLLNSRCSAISQPINQPQARRIPFLGIPGEWVSGIDRQNPVFGPAT